MDNGTICIVIEREDTFVKLTKVVILLVLLVKNNSYNSASQFYKPKEPCLEDITLIKCILDMNNIIVETPNPPKYCDREDYTGFWYGCYKKHRNPQSWESAKSICQGEGAFLVTIIWDAENAGVQLMTADDDLPVWTGGRDVDVRVTDETNFYFLNVDTKALHLNFFLFIPNFVGRHRNSFLF